MRHAAQKGDEESHFRPAVEPRVARERPRDPAHAEGALEGIGVAVGANEDGDVLVWTASRMLGGDDGGDLVRLARHGVEGQMLRRLAKPQATVRGAGHQPLVDLLGHLEAVGVVVSNEAVGGVEDRLRRSAVFLEDHLPGPRIRAIEVEDIAHGRAAKTKDRLIVVAHHRDVPVPRGEELHQLELRVVGVLELIDEDVAESRLIPLQDVRARAQETQGQNDLVAEVHVPLPSHQPLVQLVGAGQLAVLLGFESRLFVIARLRQQHLGVVQVLRGTRRPRP